MRPAAERRRAPLFGLVLAGLLAGLACSDSSSIGPGDVVAVRVVPDTVRLVLGKADTVQAFPMDADGAFLPGKGVSWSSDNALIATVAEDGTVTAMGLGMALITAQVGSIAGTAPVVVSPAPDIGLSTDSVAVSAVAQSGATPSATVGISNAGGSTLDSLALGTITYSAGGSGWITASLDQVTAPATLTLDVTTNGLALGQYTAVVPVTAPSALNSPQTVTVVLDLTADVATTMVLAAGNNQTAAVGTTLPTAPAVLITDQFGNPVSGVNVTFAVTGGGGSLTGATPVSDANGIAALAGWQLGTTVGNNSLSATAAGLNGSPVGFTAIATPGAASQIVLNAGNGQSAIAGQAVSVPPSVVVRDQFGNPVSGVAVSFAVTSGGGSVTGAAQTSGVTGLATVGNWTLGTIAGGNSLTASAAGLTGSPVAFTATGTPGPATSIAILAGNNQSATAGTAVSVAPAVRVTDVNGNGVPGVGVNFVVSGGGGSVTGGSTTTNGLGNATVGSWQLGGPVGPNTLTATAPGVGNVNFTATGTTGPAALIQAAAGDNQAATAGSPVPLPPSVLVTDINGNPVAGVAVTFAVASGGGSITGATPATNAQGIATVGSWTLGGTAGPNSLTATSAGLGGSPVTFNATGNPGNASTLALNGGNGQSGTVGAALATPISVLVTDNLANPVSGVTVSWSAGNGGQVDCGGGNVASCSSLSNGSGIASASWTLGTVPGAHSATGSVGGLTGSPVNFAATALVGPPSSATKSAGDNQTVTVNTAVGVAPAVLVTDQFGNPVSGVAVTFTPTLGGGSVTGGSTSTDVNGVATVGSWTLGTTAGANSLSATVTGLGSVVFGATGTAGAATQIAISAGNGQSATVNTAVATAPSVLVRDGFNNPVAGVSVTFSPTAGGGAVTGGSQSTSAAGIATVTSWTLGTVAGTSNNTLQASAAGVGSVNFSASALAGAVATITPNGIFPTSATVNTALATDPSVLAQDQFGNPVPGVAITFTRTAGGGSVNCGLGATTACNVTTTAGGIATVTAWIMGTVAGTNNNSLSVTRTGATGTSFTASALAGPVTSLILNSTNNQTARPGTTVASDPSVIARDAFANPVPGVSVTFTVTAGGGTIVCLLVGTTSCSETTNASGVATLTSWTLSNGGSPVSGTYVNTVNASSGTGSFNFNATARYSFASDVQPILVANGCTAGCHGFNMEQYAAIVNVASACGPNYITPSNTSASYLYQKIISASPACGGQMPAGGPFLSAATSNIIRDWINNAAPNN